MWRTARFRTGLRARNLPGMTGEEAALPTVRLHGRAPQLSRIRAWWHQPPAHRAALLVAGEPGLGRTAVLRWADRKSVV